MSNSIEILRALQAGKINPEKAEKLLVSIEKINDKGGIAEESQKIQSIEETCNSQPLKEHHIAIVGMSGRYPQASNLNQYWDNLVQGKNSIQEIPASRWDVNKYYDSRPFQKGKIYCKWLGMLEDIEYFDPLFFNIPPKEAECMDPQHRIFLQEAYKSFEDAGYSPLRLNNKKCGVYLGIVTNNEYNSLMYKNQTGDKSTTGNSCAIAAARVPYYLNLKGPAISIDTACSSSLVAAHLACQALWNQEIDMALVGGVTLYLTPESYLGMCEAGMLSPEGQCKTFDNDANGFVPGEGVGTLVLKRLKDAEADQDMIYGVIIGSGINQDGKTNGITAPSVNSQIELARGIYEKYKIHPESISYAEMHGTGTKLGDPIELEALASVFKEQTRKKKYCAIGSVKSNIGHISAAAGVASVQKVLLCLKHKKIVPTLNFKKPNEHFDFADSPFYVNTSLQDWPAAEQPRRACVSSFGFSGTNAHLVLEEYIPKNEVSRNLAIIGENSPALFVLSAKNEEQLKVYANLIGSFIQSDESLSLADAAYTLQVGREAMEYRLAFVADSRDNLIGTLQEFSRNNIPDGVLTAQLKKHRNIDLEVRADEKEKELLRIWIRDRNLSKIAEAWVEGVRIDWKQLYGEIKPQRISLPTYPFVRQRYWLSAMEEITITANRGTFIHPLLQLNTSNLYEQQFTSTFTGEEKFFKDHVVKGQKILPGAAHLEMARVAVEQAVGWMEEDKTRLQLKNIVWLRPLVIAKQAVQVHVALVPEDNGQIAYEIYSRSGDSQAPIIYSQGKALLIPDEVAQILNLKSLQDECAINTLPADELYGTFRAMGIEYGPTYKGIEKLYLGDRQVLAKLCLPAGALSEEAQCVLHPGLLDSALQSLIGLVLSAGNSNNGKPVVPFALQEVQVLGKCTCQMWALARYSQGSKDGDKTEKFDVDLCDETGRICVKMRGFSARALEGKADSLETPKQQSTLLFEPFWKEKEIGSDTTVQTYGQRLVILCEPDEKFQKSRTEYGKDIRYLVLQSQEKGIEKRFLSYGAQVFTLIQDIMRNKPKEKSLIQLIVFNQSERQLFSGLYGFLQTAQLENPKLLGQLIEVGDDEDTGKMAEKLEENSCYPLDYQVRYQNGKRYVMEWKESVKLPKAVPVPWKNQGVYLFTGGNGGLGFIFAEEIVNKVKDTTIILTGRSPLNEKKQAKIKEWVAMGNQIQYKQVDVTEKKEIDNLIQSITQEFGNLHGIIHAAGVIQDNFILKKTKEEVQKVLLPKVSGLVNLDEASKELNLDFFIFFSSVAGSFGNSGQSDYSAANAFMDNYAKYRNELVGLNKRQGKTLSINWPLWKAGGMHIEEETEKTMLQNSGMIPLENVDGISALYCGLTSAVNQVMVLNGEPKRIRQSFSTLSSLTEVNKVLSLCGEELSQEKIINYLKKIISSTIKIPIHQIDADDPMDEYGIDSIIGMQMTNYLEEVFGSLPKTLFFEYQNIRELADYFFEFHREQMTNLLGIREKNGAVKEPEPVIESVTPLSGSCTQPRIATVKKAYKKEEENKVRDIAIIGLAGRYPGARNIREFWENLRDGKDCITQIPKSRWDFGLYFDEDRHKPGKAYCKWGGFVEGVEEFDPLFFKISPGGAEVMDPMERLFLETVWELIEDAGCTRETLQETYQSKVGVYVGAMYQQYQSFDADISKEAMISVASYNSIANRVSYFFNFHGPSIAIDTACSSSSNAIHMACESLIKQECRLAIAGGVNLSIHPKKYIGLSGLQLLASQINNRSFGSGDGFIPGEGIGAVLLKPLSEAIQDGDSILAVIKSTAINHGGHTNGYAVPNPKAQAELIEDNFMKSGINPRTVSYVEAAANGSALGDSIEFTALNKVFQNFTQDKQFCAIGSVKSNIGHAEAASGISQLTKVVLQLQHKQLVPTIKAKPLNPGINLDNTAFYLQEALQEWKRPVVVVEGKEREIPRRATISSFGAGGSNSHLIVEEYIPDKGENSDILPANMSQILIFSAKNSDRLQAVAQQMLEYAEHQKQISLTCLAYTLQVGREAMDFRLAMVVKNREEMITGLQEFLKFATEDKKIECSVPIIVGELKEEYLEFKDLFSGKAGDAFVQALLQEKNLEKIALYWVKGGKFSWDLLYKGQTIKKLSLPTYPFEKNRYWVALKLDERELISHNGQSEGQESVDKGENFVQYNGGDILGRVTKLIQDILRLPSNKAIHPKKQLIEYGMDSIIGIQLQEKIRKELGISIDIGKFFSEFTLQEIVRQIESRDSTTASASAPALRQWETDKKLPTHLLSENVVTPFIHNDSVEKVFLTGATGLLGAFMCHEILQKTSAGVYCLVRAKSQSLGLKHIQDNLIKHHLWKNSYESRIVPVLGDLSKPLLGIKKQKYDELSISIERIYHCAAHVNHILNYQSLKVPNVTGTLSIIEFAGNGRCKPIHFVSSTVVCAQTENNILVSVHQAETAVEQGGNLVNGYAQTKWVSEQHLLQAQQKGIPITIFRCGQITGTGKSCEGIAKDMFHTFLKIFSEVEVVADWEGVMDMVPVDYVSQAIFAVSQQNTGYGKIYNIINPDPISIQEVFKFLQKRNSKIRKVSFEEWSDYCLQYINNLPESPMKKIIILFFAKNNENHQLFTSYFESLRLCNDNLQKALENSMVRFPLIDEKWWEKFISQIRSFNL